MQVKWGQSHDDVERKVPIAILEWSSLINPESIEPFLPKAPPSTEHNHSCAFSLHSERYYVFVLFSYSKCRKMKGEWDNDVLQAWFKPIPPHKHHSWVCLGKWLWYISYLTISTLILQPQPNANVCFYLSRNAMMTLSGRLRGLKGNTAGTVCAVDLSSFMRLSVSTLATPATQPGLQIESHTTTSTFPLGSVVTVSPSAAQKPPTEG